MSTVVRLDCDRRRRILPMARAMVAAFCCLAARPAWAQQSAVGVAAAAPTDPADLEVDAHCRYALSVAESRGALLASPWVFSNLGTVGIGGAPGATLDVTDAVSRRPRLAFQAGMGFSPTRLYTASLVDESARAECATYRADRLVQRVSQQQPQSERAPLEARARVLRAALPDARELLADRQHQLDNGRATLQDYTVSALKVQALQRDLTETEGRLAKLEPAVVTPPPPAGVAFEALRRAEAARQAADARLRRAAAFDVTMRGGFQETFALAGDPPVFAAISAQFVPGWFWQPEAEQQAAAAQRDRVEARIGQVRVEREERQKRLSAELEVARTRLAEVSTVLEDLEQRYNSLREVDTRQSRDFREYLWFDLVQLRANRAYAAAEVQQLGEQIARGQEDGN